MIYHPYVTYEIVGQELPRPEPGRSLTVATDAERAAANRERERSTANGIAEGFRQITPSLVLVAIATGASFAIGNWIAHRWILPARK